MTPSGATVCVAPERASSGSRDLDVALVDRSGALRRHRWPWDVDCADRTSTSAVVFARCRAAGSHSYAGGELQHVSASTRDKRVWTPHAARELPIEPRRRLVDGRGRRAPLMGWYGVHS